MLSNNRLIKIAIVDQSPDLGGAEVSILTFLKNMDRSRFDATVILPCKGQFSKMLEMIGIPFKIVHLPMGLIRLKRKETLKSFFFLFLYIFVIQIFLLRLYLYLKKNHFHLVITNTIKAHLYGSLVARFCSIPLLWRFHDILSFEDFSYTIIRWIAIFGKIFPRKILAVSRTVGDRLVEIGIERTKIEILFNGIDENHLKINANFKDFRKEYGLKNESKLIGCIGRIIPQKGQKVLLSAIRRVIQEVPEAFFILIGEIFLGVEGYRKELLEIIDRNGIEEKVIMVGFQPDIGEVIQPLDIVVLPSISPEAFGLSLIEAMALKKPVIASDIGGVREIIEDGVNGFLVEPNRPDLLAERIIDLLKHPDMGYQMAERAQERVREEFSLAKYISGMEDACYKAIIKEARVEGSSCS